MKNQNDSASDDAPKTDGTGALAVAPGSASVLRDFNAWRRDDPRCTDCIHPASRIGEAIDDAISALEPWREAKDAPEEKTEVLATYVGVYGPCLGNLIGKRFYPYQERCLGTEPFTHWMRIPTPPNTQGQGRRASDAASTADDSRRSL